MVNFVLEHLNSNVTLDVAASIYSEAPVTLDVSATAVFEISLTDMQDMFKYQTDSNDVIDVSSSDIKYYVDQSKWPSLNPANAMMSHGSSVAPIATTNSAGDPLAANKQMVCHDFVRYLALQLFNTHFGVDLFQNELELLNDIRTNCGADSAGQTWYDIVAKITAVGLAGDHEGIAGPDGDGNKYMTNDTADNTNLCRQLMVQMLNLAPARFASIENVGTPQILPFAEDDTISFKLTINPAADQELVVPGVDPIGSRSYAIKFILKETPANTEVAEDETA